jgi:hypothetical protein
LCVVISKLFEQSGFLGTILFFTTLDKLENKALSSVAFTTFEPAATSDATGGDAAGASVAFAAFSWKSALAAPQSGQTQSAGKSAHFVPGAIPS